MPIPYSRSPQGKMLWKGKDPEFSDFKAIVQYCRQCVGEKIEGVENHQLSSDWASLIDLMRQLLRMLPSNSKLRKVCTLHLPSGKAPLPKPDLTRYLTRAKTKRARQKAKAAYDRALVAWNAQQEYEQNLPLVRHVAVTAKGLGIALANQKIGDVVDKIRVTRSIMIHRIVDLRARRDGIVRPQWMNRSIETLPWDILPPGDWGTGAIRSWLSERLRGGRVIEEMRLRHLFDLNPVSVYRGNGQFASHGYLAFVFGENGPAALESGFVGNATYVLSSDWQKLSKLTKRELVELEKKGDPRVRRLVHLDMNDWTYDVCSALRRRMPTTSNEY